MIDINSKWLDSFFAKQPAEQWDVLFSLLTNISNSSNGSSPKSWYAYVEQEADKLDSILASAAWDLWQSFGQAKRASQKVIDFWSASAGPKAVLLLDSLSIREIALVSESLAEIGAETVSYTIAGSEIPSDTDHYAEALGLGSRSQLKKQSAPGSFKLSFENDTYIDSMQQIPFDECAKRIQNSRNLFIWHGWPDDALHEKESAEDAFNRFIDHTAAEISSDGFKEMLKVMSQGRDLLITSDHGYCHSGAFLVSSGDAHEELKALGFKRAKKLDSSISASGYTLPPVTLDLQSTSSNIQYRLAIGKRRPDHKGFPKLTHGGLSLLECCVPLLHVRRTK